MWEKDVSLPMGEEQGGNSATWGRVKTTLQQTVVRARVCPLPSQGLSDASAIAGKPTLSRPTVIQQFFGQRKAGSLPTNPTHPTPLIGILQ